MNTTVPLVALICLIAGGAIGWLLRDRKPPVTATGASPAFDPIYRALDSLNSQVRELEVGRAEAFATMSSQFQHMAQAMAHTNAQLTQNTSKLAAALTNPQVRGRWGEIQLERVVELSGMVKHCDFETQAHRNHQGAVVRPDMVIHLSGERNLIVDAKVPFSAYLDAINSGDPEEQQGFLNRHAHLVRTHITALSGKEYISAFQPTPEFVVMFVPADPFLDAALSADSELLEFAFSRNVIIATPTTLIALLRTVAITWQQHSVNERAATVLQLGKELHNRLTTLVGHLNKVGHSLDKASQSFNAAMSSMESRVMVTARKMSAEAGLKNLPSLRQSEESPENIL
ncbi:MAG: DNA recombination protein RmuC [Corynebacterium sp.]|uniref:DNA recombination protein RmuC n=1 Tax=Corynebacterium sp. TaxID=1720 RepID=UPI0026DB7F81|nr:DNA recombination protein RmuC [Corynebacterium sp.]MDO5097163.1 DNA recombination protein RmuC [Corynebacterium sp.]